MRIPRALHIRSGIVHTCLVAHRPGSIVESGSAATTFRGMGILDGKKIVITGVLTDASLAFGVAKIALEEGAEIVLTGAGRALSLTKRTARKLGDGIDVFELDVTVPEQVEARVRPSVRNGGRVDGVLHAIGFAPESCLGDDFFGAPWEDVAVAMHISTYSLKTLADAFVPLMDQGGSFVGLDFDNQQAWPAYNWMGVAKSALQSSVATWPASSGRSRSAATSSQPGRSRRWPPSRSPASSCSRTPGTAGRHSVGTSTTPSPWPRRASRCCPTGSPPRPVRSSTSTAATTPSVPERATARAPLRGPGREAPVIDYAATTVTCTEVDAASPHPSVTVRVTV